MSILSYVQSLLPNFERRHILDDLEHLSNEVSSIYGPSLAAAVKVTGGKNLKTDFGKALDKQFVQAVPSFRSTPFLVGAQKIYADLSGKLDLLRKEVEQLFEKDVTKEAMTYRKASVLQFIEAVRFANRYTGKTLLHLYAAEAAAARGEDANAVDSALTPAEKTWLQRNRDLYLTVLNVFAIKNADLKTALESIPDIKVGQDTDGAVMASHGPGKLDPMRLGLLPVNLNPIYHIRLHMAERQVAEYKAKIEEKRALELRILDLQAAMNGKADAKLQQQIDYYEGRLQKMNYDLLKTEEALS